MGFVMTSRKEGADIVVRHSAQGYSLGGAIYSSIHELSRAISRASNKQTFANVRSAVGS